MSLPSSLSFLYTSLLVGFAQKTIASTKKDQTILLFLNYYKIATPPSSNTMDNIFGVGFSNFDNKQSEGS